VKDLNLSEIVIVSSAAVQYEMASKGTTGLGGLGPLVVHIHIRRTHKTSLLRRYVSGNWVLTDLPVASGVIASPDRT
jgi:hypothetical protein